MKEWRKHGGDMTAKPDCDRLECYGEVCVETETCYGLTPERLAELRRIAEAATPGPWINDPERRGAVRSHWDPPRDGVIGYQVCVVSGNGPQHDANRDHITAFHPRTVIDLLDEIERLRQQNATLRSALSELVTLKDEVKHRAPADYEHRKPRAWQAAREALERVQETGVILTADDCLILMWGLIDPDEYLCTGDGQTIPPSEDTPEMRATREHYRRLMERIIDVGTGYAGGAEGA